MTIKSIEIDLNYLPIYEGLPRTPQELHGQAASNDNTTVNSWRDIWINNFKENHKNHGPFHENGIGKLFGRYYLKPCIVAGSGPSLANNIDELKNKKGVPLVSCLHNFHFMEDNEIDVDFYVTLDAGKVTIEEISEGGREGHEFYVEKTKGKKLLAFVGTDPGLIASWKGEIYWYNCPIPDEDIKNKFNEVERFDNYISNGGNVLGACLYFAKAYMGANPIVFVGADFSFGYKNNFHPWKSKYDEKVGQYIRAIDCFGMPVKTWQSYYNFKLWFDLVAQRVPGIYINASEDGCLGAYREGNIAAIKQMWYDDMIELFTLHRHKEAHCKDPASTADFAVYI